MIAHHYYNIFDPIFHYILEEPVFYEYDNDGIFVTISTTYIMPWRAEIEVLPKAIL